MKKTTFGLMLILATLSVALAEEAGKSAVVEQGRFIILYRSQMVGYEEYKLSRDNTGALALHSECAFLLPKGSGNVRFAYKIDLAMDSSYTPIRFDELFLLNESENWLHVQFRDGKASDEAYLGGQTLSRAATVHPQFSVLEESVYALYAMMYRKYQTISSAKADKAHLWLYIPKTGIEIPGQFTFANDILWSDIKLRRYLLDVGRFQGVAVDVDETGRLMRLFIARQDIEVIRDLEYDRNPATPAPVYQPPTGPTPAGEAAAPTGEQTPPPIQASPPPAPTPAPAQNPPPPGGQQ